MTIYQMRSISKAADKLNISPQGLGKILRGIETELGGKLFVRFFNGVQPSDFLNALYPHICTILEATESIEHISKMYRNTEKNPSILICKESIMGNVIKGVVHKYNDNYGKNVKVVLLEASEEEIEWLVGLGWIREGIAWYGMAE